MTGRNILHLLHFLHNSASPVPGEKSADFEMDGGEDFQNSLCLWAAALKQIRLLKGWRSRRGFCKVGTTCKPRQRLPQKPHTKFPLGERNALLMRSVKSAFALLLTKVTQNPPLRRRKEYQLYDHNIGGKTYKTNNQRNVRRWSRCS